MLLVTLMGVFTEMLRFMKWYITIRRRVTSNCLHVMQRNVKSLQDPNLLTEKDFELSMNEKISVCFFFLAHRIMLVVHVLIILMSYNFWIVLFTCVGMAIGNLIFAGLTQDQVLINRVKKEIKIKKVMN